MSAKSAGAEHKTEVSSTMGWWQAFCSCGWLGPKSYPTRAPAERDANRHRADAKS